MTSIAITMMIVALLVIWGGLIFSLIRLPKEGRAQHALFCYLDKSI